MLVAYAGPESPVAALRASVLYRPTDIHSLFVNKPSSSSKNVARAGPPTCVAGAQGGILHLPGFMKIRRLPNDIPMSCPCSPKIT
jgi:hypothetical protein